MEGKRTSNVWHYFKAPKACKEKIACCNICKKHLSYKTSMTNLKRHLSKKHSNISLRSKQIYCRKSTQPQIGEMNVLIKDEESKKIFENDDTPRETGTNEDDMYASIEFAAEDYQIQDDFSITNVVIPKENIANDSNIVYTPETNICHSQENSPNLKSMKISDVKFDPLATEFIEEDNKISTDNIDHKNVPIVQNKIEKKRTSNIWLYFKEPKKNNEKFAMCNICKKFFSYKTTLTNLKRHLLIKHKSVYFRNVRMGKVNKRPTAWETGFRRKAEEKDDDIEEHLSPNIEEHPLPNLMSMKNSEEILDSQPISEENFENNTQYRDLENLSIEELKKSALIAQIKLFREQEAAARVKKKLNMYKLSMLKKNDKK